MKVCPECDRQFGDDAEFCAKDGTELETVEGESADPMIGRVLDGQWKIEERLGEGGMGTIYVASQKSVGRQVAVKTLRTSLSENEEFTERFMREARVTSEIHHPHCVTIYDYGRTEDGTLYLAMELLDGEPLGERLERERPSMVELLEVGAQIASALAAAHEHGIVHRDLKPDNVFLLDTPDDSTFAKVLDFGISKEIEDEEDLTQTGELFGTPSYMSPEQSKGEAIDGRTDLYSLGCMLYEMAVGEPPFSGGKPMAVLMAHVQGEVTPMTELADRPLPAELTSLVDELLSKDPELRPDSAAAVKGRLETLASQIRGTGGVEVRAGLGGEASEPELAHSETLAASGSETPTDTGEASGKGEPSEAMVATSSGTDRSRVLTAVVVGCLGVGAVGVLGGVALYTWGPRLSSGAFFGGGADGGTSEGEDAKRVAERDATGPGADASRVAVGPGGDSTGDARSNDVGRGDDVARGTRVAARGGEEGESAGAAGGSEGRGGERDDEDEAESKPEVSSGSDPGAPTSGDESAGGSEPEEGSEETDDEAVDHLEEAKAAVENANEGDGGGTGEEKKEKSEPAEAETSTAPDESEDETRTSSDESDPSELADWSNLTVRPPCDEGEFRTRLDALRSEFGRCASRTGVSGDVGVEFDLVDTGEKLRMETWGSAVDGAGSCVRQALEQGRFPAPESGICFTRFTVELEADGGEHGG